MGEPSHVVDISDDAAGVSARSSSANSSSDVASANGDVRTVQEELLNNINKLAEAINLLSEKLAIADEKSKSDPSTASHQRGDPGVLMVVATLIATITFQAALNPPGGFIPPKDDDATITPRPPLYLTWPGEAVLRDNLTGFLLFDLIAFLASLSIILLFICVVPRKKKKFMRFLACVMWVAVVSTAIALSSAIFQILPVTMTSSILVLALGGIFGIFGLFVLWLLVRFVVYLTRKIVTKIKTSGVRSATSTPESVKSK